MDSKITVTGLFTYPIKSCGRLSHQQIELDERGPVWDRHWMVVEPDGMFITAREAPTMQLIQPAFENGCMRLTAPGMTPIDVTLQREPAPSKTVKVWNAVCEAVDEGDDLAAWLSDYLKVECRLVRMMDGFKRLVDPNYAHHSATTGFSDGFPMLIVSEASLAELNRRLEERGKTPVPMSRFRPNVVMTGCDAFAEDEWKTIQIGSMMVDVVKPCARCVMTTVDSTTGQIPDTAEPLATLNTFRKQGTQVMFAQNVIHRAPGSLAVGNVVMTM
jgi:uncharacterized protein YcbX